MVLPGMASDIVVSDTHTHTQNFFQWLTLHIFSPHLPINTLPMHTQRQVCCWSGRTIPPLLWLHHTTCLSRIVTADPKWPTHNTALVWRHIVCNFLRTNPILWKNWSILSFFDSVVSQAVFLNGIERIAKFLLSQPLLRFTLTLFVFTSSFCHRSV